MLTKSEALKEIYPNAKLGILIMKDVDNLKTNPKFNEAKLLVKERLLNQHQNYSRKEFTQTEPICFYTTYYKQFKKTYPVLLQIESIILKSKPLPTASTLVEAMFIAELKNSLLTAAHDYDKIKFPLNLNLSNGNEHFLGISEKEQNLVKDDMMLSDADGIISSILNGPDYRTRITSTTKNVLFYTYIPDGINKDIILNHLKDIASFVAIFSPNSQIDLISIL